MKIIRIGLFLLFGLLAFGAYKYYLQPAITVMNMQSIPDCIFAAHVGTGSPGDVQFSPDGKLLAIMSNSRHSILDAKSGDFVCDFEKGKEKSTHFRFSPDSSMFALGDGSTIHMIDTSGEKLREIDISKDGKLGFLGDIAFATNLNAIIATCKGGFCIYETSGKRLKHIPSEKSIRNVATVEGSIIGSNFKGTVFKWTDTSGELQTEIQAHEKYFSKSIVSPNGKLFLTLGRDHENTDQNCDLKIWSTEDLSLIHSIPIGQNVTDFSVDANSKYLLISKSTGEAFVFSLEKFDILKTWQMRRGISTSDISPDASSVCFGLNKSVTSINTDTHHDFTTGRFRQSRNGKPIPYQTIKGQSVSPGAVVVLASRLDEVDAEDSDPKTEN